jgi:hypothetical protein
MENLLDFSGIGLSVEESRAGIRHGPHNLPETSKLNRDGWRAGNGRRKIESRSNAVRPNRIDQPEALHKRSREHAGEVGDGRLDARVAECTNSAIRIRRVIVDKSAEQSKKQERDQGHS